MKAGKINTRATDETVARLNRLTDLTTKSQADVVANALFIYEKLLEGNYGKVTEELFIDSGFNPNFFPKG